MNTDPGSGSGDYDAFEPHVIFLYNKILGFEYVLQAKVIFC